MSALVVGWDGNINVVERGVGITEGDAGNVHVCGFLHGSGVGSWVTDDDESWLQELLGVLVGKSTWSPLSTEVVGFGVSGELENGSLGILSV